ncbi:MAG: GNAT family N-acetyltransferase [Devosia sp.]|nr:GNAT family N-acetyltransferase [Devosia sp.]
MAEPAVRRLTLADRAQWAALRHALWPHHAVAELGAELPALLNGAFAGFGAFGGETLVGFAEVSERGYGDGCDTAPVAWLEGIYVAPDYRRGGVARSLVEATMDWAKAAGYAELGSDAAIDNLVSRLSHARWGFEETRRSVMFRKVLT